MTEHALREALYKLARTPYKFGSMRSDETIIERAFAVAEWIPGIRIQALDASSVR